MTTPTAAQPGIVILGASHAGVAVAAELRSAGCDEPIVLVGEEDCLPYHRPHLSKDSLEGEMPDPKPLRPETFFVDQRLDRRCGVQVVSIDRANKRLVLLDGSRLAYDRLVLATGARARELPASMPGAQRAVPLRHREDWRRLAERLREAKSLTVIGGGLIGLEVAAAARARGLQVTVVETADRLMARTLYAPFAEEAAKRHRANGIDIRLGAGVEAIDADTVRLSDGSVVPADIVIAAVGSAPREELARDAGLDVRDGVVVNERGVTSDPAIYAVGDCARVVSGSGAGQRHESVAATQAQARNVAAALMGRDAPPLAPLRLWSFQGALRFQMAGEMSATARCDVSAVPDGLMLHAFEGGRLVAVQAMNAPRPFNAEVPKIGEPEAAFERGADPVLQP